MFFSRHRLRKLFAGDPISSTICVDLVENAGIMPSCGSSSHVQQFRSRWDRSRSICGHPGMSLGDAQAGGRGAPGGCTANVSRQFGVRTITPAFSLLWLRNVTLGTAVIDKIASEPCHIIAKSTDWVIIRCSSNKTPSMRHWQPTRDLRNRKTRKGVRVSPKQTS